MGPLNYIKTLLKYEQNELKCKETYQYSSFLYYDEQQNIGTDLHLIPDICSCNHDMAYDQIIQNAPDLISEAISRVEPR